MQVLQFSTRSTAVSLVLVFSLAAPASLRAADTPAVLYRIFLSDGATLVSYGEYARVDDHVVFSIPTGTEEGGQPRLELVSLPAARVDWPATERYAFAARASQYAASRGEADFVRMNNEVARALNEASQTSDAARRLQIAEDARRTLADWSSHSYGYRAAEAAQLGSMLDEVVSELRVASGARQFDLSFVANMGPVEHVPLMKAPTLRESVEQVLRAARLSDEPAQRVALLKAAARDLDALPADDESARELRGTVLAEVWVETEADRVYSELTASTLQLAQARARQADVRGVEALLQRVKSQDERLGRRRPREVSALLGAIETSLQNARELRLARDHWAARRPVLLAYRQSIAPTVAAFERSKPLLDHIKSLAGPSPVELRQLRRMLATATLTVAAIVPPTELEPAHAMLRSALQLASSACQSRRDAVDSGSMPLAWEASSAAAGGLMLFARVTEELQRFLTLPEPR